jgi:hypothetical protein
MPSVIYRVTVDSKTCTVTKLERVDDEGGYEEFDLSKIRFDFGDVGSTAIVVNIYGGGPAMGPKDGVKLTDGDDLCIKFPYRPPGRAR